MMKTLKTQKTLKPANAPPINIAMSLKKVKQPPRLALTTGQAAEYCFVTPGTILNWIHSGRLPHQRTAGGQFRIPADRLRQFMIEQGMSVEAMDRDCCLSRQLFCWEYFGQARYAETHDCRECIVRKSRSLNCYELRNHVDHQSVFCMTSCGECLYYQAYADEQTAAKTESQEGGTPQ